MIEVDAEVLDLGRRLREGDELWRGDPSMSLQWNTITGKFEVWGADIEGRPYMAWTGDDCTPRMLVELTEWDWQRGSKAIIDKLAAAAASKEAAEQARIDDMTNGFVDKLGWTISRVFNGRRKWGFEGRRR